MLRPYKPHHSVENANNRRGSDVTKHILPIPCRGVACYTRNSRRMPRYGDNRTHEW